MSIGTWHRVAVAGLLAGALVSCAHERRTAARAQQPTEAERMQQAFRDAAKRQEELTAAQKRLDTARQDVARAQQQLAAAQQREERERATVQQLGVRARQDLERANELAQQQQLAAEQAQGLTSAAGRITEATPSRVLLQTREGRTMSFQLDPRTQVLVGAEQRSISAVQQGADARVTYDPKGPEPTALTIRVTPVTRPGREAGQAPPAAKPPEPARPPAR